jgi:hypothetical protein
VKLFIKVLFGAGIPFGILLGVVYTLEYDLETGIRVGPAAGAAFGLIFGLVVCLIHLIAKKRAGLNGTSDRAAASQTLDLSMDAKQAFDLVLAGLEQVRKCEVTHADRETGIIEAESGQTWKSWGERIAAQIVALESGKTRLTLTSRSAVKTTLVDFGKNQENILAVLSVLPK